MFGRKKSTEPVAPWSVQVLTREHLIRGLMQPDRGLILPVSVPHSDIFTWNPLVLESAQIETTGPWDVPPISVPSFTLRRETIIAYLPGDEASRQALAATGEVLAAKKPLRGVFHFWPYLIEGTMMFFEYTTTFRLMPVAEAHIVNRLPGAKVAELRAPLMVANLFWMQGYQAA